MQKDIFDIMYENFKFDKSRPVRVFETFAGIGFQRMALDKAGIEHESVGISEIDKFALQSYEAIHGHTKNYGSITDIKGSDIPKQIDLFTYSFPCTDLSQAGQQKGMGKGTRSGLVYEVLRILEELNELDNLPQVLIMENVTALINKRFINEFTYNIKQPLKELGYTNHVFKMNAREYGVPQNRDRVFMVSILGKYNYNVPDKVELETKLRDLLEEKVDEKYFLSESQVDRIKNSTFQSAKRRIQDKEYVDTLLARDFKDPKCIRVNEKTKKGYKEAYEGDGIYVDRPHQKRGVVQKGMTPTVKANSGDIGVVVETRVFEQRDDEGARFFKGGVVGALRTFDSGGHKRVVESNLTVRKLTPRETGRLMGMNDEQIDKQLEVVSNSQAYKQHGNGIVVDVFAKILEQMKGEVK